MPRDLALAALLHRLHVRPPHLASLYRSDQSNLEVVKVGCHLVVNRLEEKLRLLVFQARSIYKEVWCICGCSNIALVLAVADGAIFCSKTNLHVA